MKTESYAGLTISDKPALMEAKEQGFDKVKISTRPRFYCFCGNTKDDKYGFVITVDEAIAQIAEMEKAEKTQGCNFCCYTEYPDTTLYPRDRSEFYAGRSRQVRVDDFDEDELNEVSYCPNCGRNLANPYTEGEQEDTADEG